MMTLTLQKGIPPQIIYPSMANSSQGQILKPSNELRASLNEDVNISIDTFDPEGNIFVEKKSAWSVDWQYGADWPFLMVEPKAFD